MNDDSIFTGSPSVVGGAAFVHAADRPFHLPMHRHDSNSELFLVTGGEGRFHIDGRAYEVRPGHLLFYQRGIWHEELSTAHPFRGMFLAFKGLSAKGLPDDHLLGPEHPPIVALDGDYEEVKRLFEQCVREWTGGAPESRTAASCLFGLLMVKVARTVHYAYRPGIPAKPAQAAVVRARRFIEENYRSPITLRMLGQAAFVSAFHLAHLFKDELGESPIQFLIRYRIDVAKRYLETTDLPLREIGERIGYQSETSFHTIFKKHSGMTPGAYRSRMRE